MPIIFDDSGLTIQTFDEILAERITALQGVFGDQFQTDPDTPAGNLIRVWAEQEAFTQEVLLFLYQQGDPRTATGIFLDRIGAFSIGDRVAGTRSLVPATFDGTEGTVIENGKRVRLDATLTEWEVVNGEYVIEAGGTVSGSLRAVEVGPTTAAATGDWTIIDIVSGWDGVTTAVDATKGAPAETDADYRIRRARTLADQGSGPLDSIRAGLLEVADVLEAIVYENVNVDPVDADGVPLGAIYCVVDGGSDADVLQEIFSKKGGGIESHGTDVTGTIQDSSGNKHTIKFDRVDLVPMYIRATLTTSTSEEVFPVDGAAAVEAELLAFANANLSEIGQDVLPYRLTGAITTPGIDAVLMEISDDGASWQTAKYDIAKVERATYDAARVSTVLV